MMLKCHEQHAINKFLLIFFANTKKDMYRIFTKNQLSNSTLGSKLNINMSKAGKVFLKIQRYFTI